jgi:hypothetical protein
VEKSKRAKICSLNQACALWKTAPKSASFLLELFLLVMAGLVPAIHVLLFFPKTGGCPAHRP